MKNTETDDMPISVPSAVGTQMFVFYDKVDGIIKTISNESMDPGEDGMIQLPYCMVEDFLSGKLSPSDFKVIFLNNKEALIVNKKENVSSEGGKLFVIPKVPITDNVEVIVEKNLKEKCWYFQLTPISKKLVTESSGVKYKHDFFIVKKFDPNILYRSFSISIYDLVSVDRIGYSFELSEELADTDVVTVRRGFTSYAMVEINE